MTTHKKIESDFVVGFNGRIMFEVPLANNELDKILHVEFKMDSGADKVTIATDTLLGMGYTLEFLKNCPKESLFAANGTEIIAGYVDNMQFIFRDCIVKNVRVYFSIDTPLRTLFGLSVLRYFDIGIFYSKSRFILRLLEDSEIAEQFKGAEQIQVEEVIGVESIFNNNTPNTE